MELDRALKEKKRSEYTINHYFTLLKALFNFAIKQKKYSGDNPIKEVIPYIVDEKRREYRSEELKQIISAVFSHYTCGSV